jgi:PAS domain S-box-containing protein
LRKRQYAFHFINCEDFICMLRERYRWKTYQLRAIVTLCAGLAWAYFSDALISLVEQHLPLLYLDDIRGLNNVLIFGITALILYRQVRKHQRQLVFSEKQYRSLFESNPSPMWLYHKDTLAFIAVNQAAIAKYGYSRDEFLQMTIRDIRSPADYCLLDESIKSDPGGLCESGTWHHIRKSGQVFPVAIVSNDVLFDGQPCKLVLASDISPIVQNEQKLRDAYLKEKELREALAIQYETTRAAEKENRVMAQVINNINNLVLIVGDDGVISWVNRAFSEFTGYTLEEIAGKNPVELLCGPQTDPGTVERLLQAVGQKQYFSEDMINYKKIGEAYWTQLTLSPICDENGTFQFYVSVETVITEKKEKEQKIRAQHVALQKIAWSNSHELRRPVCSIMGLISVLKDIDNGKDRDHCLQALEKCARELDRLIREINQKTERMVLSETHVE